ncbi:MAG: DUF6644 family protein [Bryobacteraceae bacterium]
MALISPTQPSHRVADPVFDSKAAHLTETLPRNDAFFFGVRVTLYQFCQFLSDSHFGTALRESQYIFPIIESIHVLGLAASVGAIVLLDLRLTGLGIRSATPGQIMSQLKPWYLTGFAAMFVSGVLLFWAEAEKCYRSPTFRWKLLFLLLAGVNALWYERKYVPKMHAWSRTSLLPAGARLIGWFSLTCWTLVIGFGRWTAYGLR